MSVKRENHEKSQKKIALCHKWEYFCLKLCRFSRTRKVNAQFNLGCCYEDGEGVQQDKLKAAKCFYKAAIQGDKSAKNALRSLLGNDGDEGETVQV